MDRYPIETLPFPVKPKDTVYFVFDSDEGLAIESDYVDTVGVDDEKRLIVCCGEYYEDKVGLKDRCFLTREDAERYIEDSAAFTDAYGTTDLQPDDIPYRPGIDVYTYDDDPPEIFGSACYIVYFTEDGEVFVVDDYCCSHVSSGTTSTHASLPSRRHTPTCTNTSKLDNRISPVEKQILLAIPSTTAYGHRQHPDTQAGTVHTGSSP